MQLAELAHWIGERLAGFGRHPAPPPVLHAAALIVVRAHLGDRSARDKISELGSHSDVFASLFGHAHRILMSQGGVKSLGPVAGGGGGGGHHGGHHGHHHGGGGRRGGGWGGWGWDRPEVIIISEDEAAPEEDADELAQAIRVAGSYDTTLPDRFHAAVLDQWRGPRGLGAQYILRDRSALAWAPWRSPEQEEPEWMPPYGVRGD